MVLRFTQPLTELSIRNLPEVKRDQRIRLTNSPPSVSRLYRKYGSIDNSKAFGLSQPFTEMASFFFYLVTRLSIERLVK
jgi:hypothetical protein